MQECRLSLNVVLPLFVIFVISICLSFWFVFAQTSFRISRRCDDTATVTVLFHCQLNSIISPHLPLCSLFRYVLCPTPLLISSSLVTVPIPSPANTTSHVLLTPYNHHPFHKASTPSALSGAASPRSWPHLGRGKISKTTPHAAQIQSWKFTQ